MITVLMCLFIVLFAMSTVDANKYAQLRDSLATGFGTTPSTSVDSAVGVIVEPEYVSEQGIGFTSDTSDESPLEQAKAEVAQFQEIIRRVDAALTAEGLQNDVEYVIDAKGLTIKLVGGQTFFGSNSAALLPEAQSAVNAIGSAIVSTPQTLTVEGFADPTPASPPFATNWELAAARSTAVLRYLVESVSIAETRISSVSYGSSRAETGDLALNRRVDIVLHSTLDPNTAALVPDVLNGTAEEPTTIPDTGGSRGQAFNDIVPTGPRTRATTVEHSGDHSGESPSGH
jgi:chemotaxis protein MotB